MTRMRKIGLTLTLLIGVAMAAPAQAASFNMVGGTAGQISGGSHFSDFVGSVFPGPQIGGYYGPHISVDLPPFSQLLFEFFGREAGSDNAFNLVASGLFAPPSSDPMPASLMAPLASVLHSLVGTGTLPFGFYANVGSILSTVANGGNPNSHGGTSNEPNFFASCNPFGAAAGSGGAGCNTLYLFIDAGGGTDDDHDDFLVRITAITPAQEAPEPATLGLLGLGLAMVARRFRR